MSPDGAWQSPAHAIYAVEPIATNIAKIPKSSGALEDAVAPMTLDYPPPNFVSSERKVTFSWIADEENTGQEAVLRVKNSLGKIVHIVTTSLTHVELSLTPGRYVWSVRHGGTKGDSMERSLEIVKARFASDRSARRDVIRRLVTSGEDAVVLLEDAR
jgi:hypothetical protein